MTRNVEAIRRLFRVSSNRAADIERAVVVDRHNDFSNHHTIAERHNASTCLNSLTKRGTSRV